MNEDNYTVTLSRLDICDLLLACTEIKFSALDEMKQKDCPEYRRDHVLPGTVAKWQRLHDKLHEQLDILDAGTTAEEVFLRWRAGFLTVEEAKKELANRISCFLF